MFAVKNNNHKFMCSQLMYSYEQNSFFCNPRFMQQYCLLVNDLELGLNENFELVSVSGLSPYRSWDTKELSLPESVQGVLKYEGESLSIGVSYRLAELPAYIDTEKNWVLIGNSSFAECAIQVLGGVMISLNCGEIDGIWLKPVFL